MHASYLLAAFAATAMAQFSNMSTTTTTMTSGTTTGTTTGPSSTQTVTPGESLQCGSLYVADPNDKFLIYCNAVAQGVTFFSTVTENLLGCIDACVQRGDACAAAQFDNRTAPYSCNLKRPNGDGAMVRRQAAGNGNRGTFAAVRVNAAGNPLLPVSPVMPTMTFSNATMTAAPTNPTVQPTLNFFTSAGLICYFRSALVSNGNTLSVFPLPTA